MYLINMLFININPYSYIFYLLLDINYYFVNGNIMILGFTLSIEIRPAKPKNMELERILGKRICDTYYIIYSFKK